MSNQVLEVMVNFFLFTAAEFKRNTDTVTEADILAYLLSPDSNNDHVASILQRYNEIAPSLRPLSVIPHEQRIETRIVFPFRAAIGSYLLGNHAAAIAMCGSVCESLTCLLYHFTVYHTTSCPPSKTKAEAFERLNQKDRINVLRILDRINDNQRNILIRVTKKRNAYLHTFSNAPADEHEDAMNCIQDTSKAFFTIFECQFEKGAVRFRPGVLEFLQQSKASKKA